jgi:hypothetical protein
MFSDPTVFMGLLFTKRKQSTPEVFFMSYFGGGVTSAQKLLVNLCV